jgi:CBS domain containing-hemolysin-like protein
VAAEFALVKVRMSQIEPLAKKGRLSATAVSRILPRLDAYLSACQLGITLASLGLGWVGEPVVAALLKPVFEFFDLPADWTHYIALPAAFVTITFLHITIGEQAPKMWAIQKEKSTALAVSLPLIAFYTVLKPVIWAINGASNLILRAVGLQTVNEHGAATADELRLMVAETIAGGALKRVERTVMKGILDFDKMMARQIMVPRPDIIYMDKRRTLQENIETAFASGKTRFPVCDGNLDHVTGMVHVRDLLKAHVSGHVKQSVAKLQRQLLILPETVRLNVLLLQFQRQHVHMAVLVDEYGGVAGMVTLEDVLEGLVGEIQDEFDHEAPQILPQDPGRWLVKGKCPLHELADRCGIEIPDVKVDTAGGLITEMVGHIPKKGESVKVGRHRFTVVDALPVRVRTLEVVEEGPEPPPAD